MLSNEVTTELDKALDPKRITTFQSGPQKGVRYLEGEDVIRTANRIFGYGGWGYRLVSPPVCVEEGEQGQNNTLYQVWTAHVEVTVDGCPPVSDLGTNTRQGKGAAALEMAIKGAVTDGIKRCLKTYGDQFGLVLYDKDVSVADLNREYRAEHGDSPLAQAAQAAGGKPVERKATGDSPWNTLATEMIHAGLTGADLRAALGGQFSAKALDEWLTAEDGRTVYMLIDIAKSRKAVAV